MLSKFLVGFILLANIFVFKTTEAESIAKQVFQKVASSVVTIYDGDNKPLGTGFFIDANGQIVTNAHVIKNRKNNIYIKTIDGKKWNISTVKLVDVSLDVGIIQSDIQDKKYNHLVIADKIPVVGESIFIIGSPDGLEHTLSSGLVSAIRTEPEFPTLGNLIQVSAPISPGSSGSPVVIENGEVVGIATLQRRVGQNLNFAISSDNIKKAIDAMPLQGNDETDISKIKDKKLVAKTIIKNCNKSLNFKSIYFSAEPTWIDFDGDGEANEFYTTYALYGQESYYFFDIHRINKNGYETILHENDSEIGYYAKHFKLGSKNHIIKYGNFGIGAFLSFKIYQYNNFLAKIILDDGSINPNLLGGSEVIFDGYMPYIKTKVGILEIKQDMNEKLFLVKRKENEATSNEKSEFLIIRQSSNNGLDFYWNDRKLDFIKNNNDELEAINTINLTLGDKILLDTFDKGKINLDTIVKFYIPSVEKDAILSWVKDSSYKYDALEVVGKGTSQLTVKTNLEEVLYYINFTIK